MKMVTRQWAVAALTAVILTVVILGVANAGILLDYGQLDGAPAAVNYMAWNSTGGAPSVVFTEDYYNSATGPGQGWNAPYWQLAVADAFALDPNNPPNPLPTIAMLFGGLGADSGTIWSYSFQWDPLNDYTDHGTVGTGGVGTKGTGSCPVMTAGSLSGNEKVINWTAPAGYYLIYRSTQGSGAANDRSNGRYDLVTTSGPIQTFSSSGTYTDSAAGTSSWHIVVPSDASGNIIGCHSVESSPTAVDLLSFDAAGGTNPMSLPWAGAGLMGIAVAGVGIRWLRQRA